MHIVLVHARVSEPTVLDAARRSGHYAPVRRTPRWRVPTHRDVAPSSSVIRRCAISFVVEALRTVGLQAEPTPADLPGDLLASGGSGRSVFVCLLAAAAPHHRGGRGSLGLHWVLAETPADSVALVDLSRASGWLIPTDDFRARAQPLSGGRFHLDWIVVALGRRHSKVASEEEFATYLFEQSLPELARQLA